MRKLSILVMFFAIFNSFAFQTEIVLKAGIDIFREDFLKTSNNHNGISSGGFVVGAEVLPISLLDDAIRIGLGSEYNFGYTDYAFKKHGDGNGKEMFVPVYLTLKASFRPGDKTKSVYGFTRLGYGYGNEIQNDNTFKNHTHGLYFGAGAGFEVYKFISEIVIGGKYAPKTNNSSNNGHELTSKVGLRLGYIIGGDFVEEIKPQISYKENKN
ncbi:hypothetical protein [Caviibacter abscessus]|uniref:hypothetical protein n=1 Tax=Caviibacter abscessus TaxID=1766719 RepID=UPI0008358BF1|nr:hypothetical protein [Caviibacter abscessus]